MMATPKRKNMIQKYTPYLYTSMLQASSHDIKQYLSSLQTQLRVSIYTPVYIAGCQSLPPNTSSNYMVVKARYAQVAVWDKRSLPSLAPASLQCIFNSALWRCKRMLLRIMCFARLRQETKKGSKEPHKRRGDIEPQISPRLREFLSTSSHHKTCTQQCYVTVARQLSCQPDPAKRAEKRFRLTRSANMVGLS